MRLEAVLLPDALHRRVPDVHRLCHHARTPVRCIGRLLLARLGHDRQPHIAADRLLAGALIFALVFEQAFDAVNEFDLRADGKPINGSKHLDALMTRSDTLDRLKAKLDKLSDERIAAIEAGLGVSQSEMATLLKHPWR